METLWKHNIEQKANKAQKTSTQALITSALALDESGKAGAEQVALKSELVAQLKDHKTQLVKTQTAQAKIEHDLLAHKAAFKKMGKAKQAKIDAAKAHITKLSESLATVKQWNEAAKRNLEVKEQEFNAWKTKVDAKLGDHDEQLGDHHAFMQETVFQKSEEVADAETAVAIYKAKTAELRMAVDARRQEELDTLTTKVDKQKANLLTLKKSITKKSSTTKNSMPSLPSPMTSSQTAPSLKKKPALKKSLGDISMNEVNKRNV
jgi:hypothetical protein